MGARGPRSRGVAAVEMALVTPLLTVLAGFTIASTLALYTRYQMLEMAHFAVTECSSLPAASPQQVGQCVSASVQRLSASFRPSCAVQVATPALQLLSTLPTGAGTPIYTVTQTMRCTFTYALPLLTFFRGAPPSFAVGASATAPFMPANF